MTHINISNNKSDYLFSQFKDCAREERLVWACVFIFTSAKRFQRKRCAEGAKEVKLTKQNMTPYDLF